MAHARDVMVQILKTKRIFEIPLQEHLKHTDFKVRVNNKLQTLTLTCALKGKKGSCTYKSSQAWTSDEEAEIQDLVPSKRTGTLRRETGPMCQGPLK